MTTELLTERDAKAIRDKWVQDVTNLVQQVKLWLDEDPLKPEINFNRVTRTTEPPLPAYEVAMLEAAYAGEGQIELYMPVRNYPGKGQVSVKHWPTMRRVRLVQDSEDRPWTVYTDSDVPLRQDWNKDNFLRLLQDLRAEI